jgi:hypothetical protein
VRYGIDTRLGALFPDYLASIQTGDLALLLTPADLSACPTACGDIVLALEPFANSSPLPNNLAARAETQPQPPLDDPALRAIVDDVLAGAVTDANALRAQLANAGYPDGIALSVFVEIASAYAAIEAALAPFAVHTVPAATPDSAAIHWRVLAEPASSTLPYEYASVYGWANADLTLTVHESGLLLGEWFSAATSQPPPA